MILYLKLPKLDNMLKIIKALYGNSDVREIIENNYIDNNIIRFSVNNDVFGNPLPYVVKVLELEIDDNGKLFKYIANEGENFKYPREKYVKENTLVLTSCNRIEQILLAIAINKEIIQEDFNLVIADCSTPELNTTSGIDMHVSDDPYNLINEFNYNTDYKKIESYVKTISKIKKFNMIHISPRFSKQPGEAVLTCLGLNAASLLGSKYAVKLTGVCNLKYDIFSKLDDYLDGKNVVTWRRTGFGNQKSTRVFACNPSELNKAFMDSGYYGWVYEYDFIERKFERIINENINEDKINHMILDERDIIVDEGIGRNDHREIILENIIKHNLTNSNDIWIKKFLNGGIWK
jgi:hypothetical protein